MPAAIPEGFTTITPSLIVDGAAKAIDLYVKALGAKELSRFATDANRIMHACLQIGTSKLFIADANEKMPATKSGFYLYFNDVEASFKQAIQGGMQKVMDPQDMFWGDRMGAVMDPFGNSWTLASHVRDVSPQEMEEARKKYGAKAA
jgi:PhnB protein